MEDHARYYTGHSQSIMVPKQNWKQMKQNWTLVLKASILITSTGNKGVFTWENSHRCECHTGMTFWFRIAFTWWLHFMLIKYTCDSKSQRLRMRYPFQSTGRPISHRNGWSFRIYMIPLRDFVPEWNSRPVQEPGWAHAGVTRAGMTFCGGIM